MNGVTMATLVSAITPVASQPILAQLSGTEFQRVAPWLRLLTQPNRRIERDPSPRAPYPARRSAAAPLPEAPAASGSSASICRLNSAATAARPTARQRSERWRLSRAGIGGGV
jgi:hypothetical protein